MELEPAVFWKGNFRDGIVCWIGKTSPTAPQKHVDHTSLIATASKLNERLDNDDQWCGRMWTTCHQHVIHVKKLSKGSWELKLQKPPGTDIFQQSCESLSCIQSCHGLWGHIHKGVGAGWSEVPVSNRSNLSILLGKEPSKPCNQAMSTLEIPHIKHQESNAEKNQKTSTIKSKHGAPCVHVQ